MTGTNARWFLCLAVGVFVWAGCPEPETDDDDVASDDDVTDDDTADDDDDVTDDDTTDDDDDDDTVPPAPFCVEDVPLDFSEQILIPAGVFAMGSEETPEGGPETSFGGLEGWGDETPLHDVSLGDYCIDQYEVTLERYEACVDDGSCDPAGAQNKDLEDVQTFVSSYPPECTDDPGHCPYHPVNCKHQQQAADLCAYEGKRLCTEAEWERAANGPGPGQQTYPWGEAAMDYSLANVYLPESVDDPLGYVEHVDSYPDGASPEGVHNMLGNVYEWVSDWYGPYETSPNNDPVENPTGPANGDYRIARGGCGFSGLGDTNRNRATFAPNFDYG